MQGVFVKFSFLLFCLSTICQATDDQTAVYEAIISEIPGSASRISGTVSVFVPNKKEFQGYIGYGGFLKNAPANLDANDCSATNGCGVHIHSGMSCATAEAQGGHYYTDEEISDPWLEEKFSSDSKGSASFSSLVYIGTDCLHGRVVVGEC